MRIKHKEYRLLPREQFECLMLRSEIVNLEFGFASIIIYSSALSI